MNSGRRDQGGENTTGGHGIKPKGMHMRAYKRLIIQHDAHVGISLNIMQQRLRMIEARFGGIDNDMNLFRKIEL